MSKIIFLDVETTGRDPKTCAIVQIGAIIEIDGEVKEEINFDIAPAEDAVIEESALGVIGKTLQEIQEYPSMSRQYSYFLTKLDKYVDKYNKHDKFSLVGYNATFDDAFLRTFFKWNGNKYYGSYFWWPAIDVAVMAHAYLIEERSKLPNFKLGTVGEYIGVDVESGDLHDAFYDIKLTKAMYNYFSQ